MTTTTTSVPTFAPLARITEDSTRLYIARCEECSWFHDNDGSEYLSLEAEYAERHALYTGHAVLVLGEVK